MTGSPTRRDVLGLAGGMVTTAMPPIGFDTAIHPDAELIAICAQHAVNIDRFNNPDRPPLEQEEDPLWHAYQATQHAISSAKPNTLAGIRAKAEAALADAATDYQPENSASYMAEVWAWHLVHDLLRLT